MPTVSRYCDPTTLICTSRPARRSDASCPSRNTVRAKPPAKSGTVLATDAALDAGHRGGALEHALLELAAALFGVALRAEVERQDGEVLGVEAGADLLRVLQAAEEQSGADERHERERDLRGHEHVAQAEEPVRSGRRARLVLELDDQVGTRGLDRRRQAEDHAGRDRHRQREEQHPHVGMEIDRVRGEERRTERPEKPLRPVGQQQTRPRRQAAPAAFPRSAAA